MDEYNTANNTNQNQPVKPDDRPQVPTIDRSVRPQAIEHNRMPTSSTHSGTGSIVGAIIIIILLVVGAFYFWGARLNSASNNPPPLILGNETVGGDISSTSTSELPAQ